MTDAKPTPARVAPHVARSTVKRELKNFTVEFNAQGESAIPAGWTPYAVHTMTGVGGVAMAIVFAYK